MVQLLYAVFCKLSFLPFMYLSVWEPADVIVCMYTDQ